MPLLLCAATEIEILPTINFLKTTHFQVDVVITGVGLHACVYALTKSICGAKPVYILQAGIAGAIDDRMSPGEVVLIKSDCIGDLGACEKNGFHSIFEMGLTNKDSLPWRNGKLVNPLPDLHTKGLRIVDAVTVNEITTKADRLNYYRNKLGAVIESMEGAGLHYTALSEDIPFMQLRAISNYAGERDKTKWQMQNAITNLNAELQQLIINYYQP